MTDSILSAPYLHNEEAAYEYVESLLWPNGPVCPKCGVIGNSTKLKGKSTRLGVYKCKDCRKPFTVKVGTIFESSHIRLNVWLQAIVLVASSKKGVSANQLHRSLGITLKSAWFMAHRLREAMREDGYVSFGVGGGAVEVDETYIGRDHSVPKRVGYKHKFKVLALVDRETKRAKSVVIDQVTARNVAPILKANIAREARLMTDQAYVYTNIGKEFAEHGVVNHSIDEYVSLVDPTIHTQTIESFFAVFKRGMKGVYQHCAHNHLHRYLAEFDFRYNNRKALGVDDSERAQNLLKGVVGKRLTYETATV